MMADNKLYHVAAVNIDHPKPLQTAIISGQEIICKKNADITRIKNIYDISQAIKTKPEYIMTFLQIQHQQSTELDKRNKIGMIEGIWVDEQLQLQISQFIDIFCLCSNCKFVDSELIEKNCNLYQNCKACNKSFIITIYDDEMKQFIIKDLMNDGSQITFLRGSVNFNTNQQNMQLLFHGFSRNKIKSKNDCVPDDIINLCILYWYQHIEYYQTELQCMDKWIYCDYLQDINDDMTRMNHVYFDYYRQK